MWLNQILVEKRKFGVAIGVRGSHSLLDIGLSLIYAIPEWLIATFGPNIPFEYEPGKFTFVNVFLLKRAEAIYRIISKMTFDKDRTFFIAGHHQGGVVAALLSWMLYRRRGAKNIVFYGFGTPHLVGSELMLYLEQHIKSIVLFTVGAESKLMASGIASQEVCWPESVGMMIPHGGLGNTVMGYYSILSAGGSPDSLLDDVQNVAEDFVKMRWMKYKEWLNLEDECERKRGRAFVGREYLCGEDNVSQDGLLIEQE